MSWFKKKGVAIPVSNEDFHFHGLVDVLLWFSVLSALLWIFGWEQLKNLIDSADKSKEALSYLKSNPLSVGIAIVSHLALLSWIRNRKGAVIGSLSSGSDDKEGMISFWWLNIRLNVVEIVYSMFITIFFLAFLWHVAKVETGYPWWIITGFLFVSLTMDNLRPRKTFPWCVFIISIIWLGCLIIRDPYQMTWPLILVTAVFQPLARNAAKAYGEVLKNYDKCDELDATSKKVAIWEMFSDKQGLLLFTYSRALLDISAFLSIFIVAYGLQMWFNAIAIGYLYATFIVFYVHFAIFLNGIPAKVDAYVEWKTYKGARLAESSEKRIVLLLKNNDQVVIPATRILRIERKA